jgi:hypothetical protein
MKNVLIISYCFLQLKRLAEIRPYILARYLPKYGYNPTVVTKYNGGTEVSDLK